MISAAQSFPNSRELAGLRRQLHLDAAADVTLYVGTLLAHHVEAAVLLRPSLPWNALEIGLLKALQSRGSVASQELVELTGLPGPVVQRLTNRLANAGLIASAEGERWRIATRGNQALAIPETPAPKLARREFFFLQHPDGTPRYATLALGGVPLPEPPPGWDFDLGVLEECIRQPAEWKQRHRFPEDVEALVRPGSMEAHAGVAPWQTVATDRAERLSLAVVCHKDDLRAFLVEATTWTLATHAPILHLRGQMAMQETFGDLLSDPEADSWHAAWRNWCTERGVPLPEAPGVQFQRRGMTLMVAGHPLRPERLRALAADAGHEEHWLLAGHGAFRCAVRIEFGSPRPLRPAK